MTRLLLPAVCFASLATAVGAQDHIDVDDCRIVPKQWARLATERIGVISLIEPEEGTMVKQDQVIVKLRDEVPLAVVEKAQAKADNTVEKQYAEASAEAAEAEWLASKEVNDRKPGTIPEPELTRLHLAVKKANLQIKQAEYQTVIDTLDLAEATAQLQTYTIKAPFPGIVVKRYKEVGEAVQQGETILEIVRIDLLKIESHIDVERVHSAKIEIGNDVIVSYAGTDRNLPGGKTLFPGKVIFVDPVVQPVTRQVRVVAEVKNIDEKLKSGLTANMKIYPKGLPANLKIGQVR